VILSEERANGSVIATFGYSRRDYSKRADQNRETYTASVSVQRNLSRRTFVSIFHSLNYTPEVTTQSVNFAQVFTEAGIISQLITRDEIAKLVNNYFAVNLRHDLRRGVTFFADGSVNSRAFSSDAFSDSTETRVGAKLEYRPNRRDLVRVSGSRRFYTYGEDLTETTTDTFAAAWERQVNKSFRSRVRLILIDDTNEQLDTGRETGSRSTQITTGGTYDVDANTHITGNIGLKFARRTGHIGENENERNAGPVFDLSLQREFVRSSLSLKLRQSFNAGFESGFDTTFVGLDYSYEITPKAKLSVGLSRSVSTSDDETTVNTDTTTVYLGFDYKIDRRTHFSVVYSGTDQISTGGSAGNVKQSMLIFSIDLLDLNHRRP
jgi:alkyl hydroperoxide reductase subunit AhpC